MMNRPFIGTMRARPDVDVGRNGRFETSGGDCVDLVHSIPSSQAGIGIMRAPSDRVRPRDSSARPTQVGVTPKLTDSKTQPTLIVIRSVKSWALTAGLVSAMKSRSSLR
jgi:hypothetical protein